MLNDAVYKHAGGHFIELSLVSEKGGWLMTSWLVKRPQSVARLDPTLSWHLEWWDRNNIMTRHVKNAESGCNLSLIVCLRRC